MTIENILAMSLALFVLAITPGPGVFAIIARALGSGLSTAIAMAIGITLGDIIFLTFAMIGATALAHVLGDFFIFVRYAGAALLVYMGIKLLLSKPDAASMTINRDGGMVKNFLAGLFLCMGNPKPIFFYLGFLPAFIDLTKLDATDGLIIAFLTAVIIGGTLIIYALISNRVAYKLATPKARTRLDRIAGSTLLGTGLIIAFKGD